MSKYTKYYNASKEKYRTMASNWANATKTMNLSDLQKRGMSLFFIPIARRFGLIKEFINLGVII